MEAFEGSLALKLDFGDGAAAAGPRPGGPALRLAPAAARLTGPDKYRILERRRRRAQIAARHLLGLMETE